MSISIRVAASTRRTRPQYPTRGSNSAEPECGTGTVTRRQVGRKRLSQWRESHPRCRAYEARIALRVTGVAGEGIAPSEF